MIQSRIDALPRGLQNFLVQLESVIFPNAKFLMCCEIKFEALSVENKNFRIFILLKNDKTYGMTLTTIFEPLSISERHLTAL